MSTAYGRSSRQAALQPTSPPSLSPRAPFIPWPVPAALFLALGIAMAVWGWHWLATLSPLLLAPYGLLLRRHQGRYYGLLLLSLVAMLLGFSRYQLWHNHRPAISTYIGQTLQLTGVSDGRYLRIDSPESLRSGRIALSPRQEAGWLELTGHVQEAPGKRNPGGFDYRAYLRRRGVFAQLRVREVTAHEAAAAGLRERLRQGVTAGLTPRRAGLLQAMTLGVRDDLDDLRDIFAASGLAHILALSGLHLGIVVAVMGLLLRFLGRWRYPLMIALVLGFVLLVGATPSIVRAGIMASAVLLTLWQGRGRMDTWLSLALAALLSLLWNPALLLDLSFQLSYLAVLGILLLAQPLLRRWSPCQQASQPVAWYRPRQLIVAAVVVSVAAQAYSLPLVLHTFSALPLLGPLVNIVAIPLATLLLPLGFAAALLGLLSLPLAAALNQLTSLVAAALIGVADLASSQPTLYWGEIAAEGFALYAIAAAALTLMVRELLRPWRALLIVSIAMGSSMFITAQQPLPEIVYLDVGQGDSVLIRLPGRKEILVDGGGAPFSDFDVGGRIVVPALRALGVSELELVIATHADRDHMEGLVSVINAIPVQQLVIGTANPDIVVFNELMEAAAQRGVPVMQVRRGEMLRIGEAQLDILNPPQLPFDDENENSVAFVLRWQERAEALFLGDISIAIEAELAFPDLNIVMAGHHGSRFSTSAAMLEATRPLHAVFSYGRNNYGHPHPTVLARLERYGVRVHETYLQGAIRIALDP